MRYLIDTDWVIHHLNGRQDIIQRLQALQAEGLGLSVIVLAELYEGVYYSRDAEQSEQKLNDFLEGCLSEFFWGLRLRKRMGDPEDTLPPRPRASLNWEPWAIVLVVLVTIGLIRWMA